MGSLGKKLTHAIYLFNNSLSFLSFYRIPGI
jgi:hypothetical protein